MGWENRVEKWCQQWSAMPAMSMALKPQHFLADAYLFELRMIIIARQYLHTSNTFEMLVVIEFYILIELRIGFLQFLFILVRFFSFYRFHAALWLFPSAYRPSQFYRQWKNSTSLSSITICRIWRRNHCNCYWLGAS